MKRTRAGDRSRLEPPLTWSDEFSVGVEAIDSQHRRLFELIAAFHGGLERNEAKHAVGELLVGLADYARYHFQTEETLMRRSGYPAERAHEHAHVAFIEKVNDMAERFQDEASSLSVEATSFLREWLVNHVLGTDRQLGEWLRTKGSGDRR